MHTPSNKIKIREFTLHYTPSDKKIEFKALSLKNYTIISTIIELNFFNVILKAFASNRLERGIYPISPDLSAKRKTIDGKETLVLQYQSDEFYMGKIDVMELQSIIERLLSKTNMFV